VSTDTDTSVTLVLPARPEYLLLARLALTGVARLAEVDEEALADVRLAVTEAAANACRHAYADGDGNVTITLVLAPDERVEVVVEDDGIGFEPETVADWRPDGLGEDGMGLAIIQAVADEVEVGPRAGGSGTRLRFTRSLRG
jgi:serine/threonine-protein kinase RsbW